MKKDNVFRTIAMTWLFLFVVLLGIAFMMLPAILSILTDNERWMWLFFFTIPTLAGIMTHYFPIGRGFHNDRPLP